MRAYLTVIKLFLSTVFLVAIGSNSFGQNVKYEKKYQKVVQRAEANFQYGDYYQGKELVRKLRKKYVKKQVTSTQNYVLLCLYETKYLVGLGRYIEVQDSLDNSMFYFNSTINKDSSKYGDALLVLTDIYSDYGNFVKAREYYDKAKAYYDQVDYRKFEVIDTNASGEKKKLEYLDPSLKMENRINDLLAKRILRIQVERGFYRESEGDYDNLIKYQASVTKREFSNVDTTLKSKTTKIKKKEFKKRQVQLASLYVEKADFFRLDNATVGYNLNVGDSKAHKSARLYFSVQNAFTITGYSGLDPDPVLLDVGPTDNGGYVDPANRSVLAPGIDRRNNYFTARTFTLGLNLGF